MSRRSGFLITVLLTFIIVPLAKPFTQSGFNVVILNGIPMGHEWITRMAGIELLGYAQVAPDVPDPEDPRRQWTNGKGKAKNLDISSAGAQAVVRAIKSQPWDDTRYASRYKAVYDVIVGERWVDIAGYNAATSRACWDAVAQEPAEIQYDHFMRRFDDNTQEGGVTAARDSRTRFVNYFVNAAMAPPGVMNVYDGGVSGSVSVDVDRNFFLLGRAAHQFEDSFSSEHTVRIETRDDRYEKVRQVKAYICSTGAEQHAHDENAVLLYTSGDVIWKPGTQFGGTGWAGYKASNMKPVALVATEATKDLWAAFIRTMGTPIDQRRTVAEQEAKTLAGYWLTGDDADMRTWYDDESHRDETYVLAPGQTGKGQTVQQCMVKLKVGTDDQLEYVRRLRETQRVCVYNAVPWRGYEDLYDTQLHMCYSWKWRNGPTGDLLQPPSGWTIPTNIPADSGIRTSLVSVASGNGCGVDKVAGEEWVWCRPNQQPLTFIWVPSTPGGKDDGAFRVNENPRLFLSYRLTTGAVKLYQPTAAEKFEPSNYKLAPAGAGWSIMSLYWQQYMWLSNQSPYITRTGNPGNANSQWRLANMQ